MILSTYGRLDLLRDRVVAGLCDWLLQTFASPRYRNRVSLIIRYGEETQRVFDKSLGLSKDDPNRGEEDHEDTR